MTNKNTKKANVKVSDDMRRTVYAVALQKNELSSKDDCFAGNCINLLGVPADYKPENSVDGIFRFMPPFENGMIQVKLGYLKYDVLSFEESFIKVRLELYIEHNGWQRLDAVTAVIYEDYAAYQSHVSWADVLGELYKHSTSAYNSKDARILRALCEEQRAFERSCTNRVEISLPEILITLFKGAVEQINGILNMKKVPASTARTKTASSTAHTSYASERKIRRYGGMFVYSLTAPRAHGGYVFHTDAWTRRGHIRRYVNKETGETREVYIAPQVCRRRNSVGDAAAVTMLLHC